MSGFQIVVLIVINKYFDNVDNNGIQNVTSSEVLLFYRLLEEHVK